MHTINYSWWAEKVIAAKPPQYIRRVRVLPMKNGDLMRVYRGFQKGVKKIIYLFYYLLNTLSRYCFYIRGGQIKLNVHGNNCKFLKS